MRSFLPMMLNMVILLSSLSMRRISLRVEISLMPSCPKSNMNDCSFSLYDTPIRTNTNIRLQSYNYYFRNKRKYRKYSKLMMCCLCFRKIFSKSCLCFRKLRRTARQGYCEVWLTQTFPPCLAKVFHSIGQVMALELRKPSL